MGQGSFLTEFRPCTTLFVRFTGIDFDSDEAESQLNSFIQRSQKTAVRHGGTLMDITIGDKGSYIYINFGAFSAHEDDSRRAVNTALELHEAAKQLDFLQPLQIGMTQGILRVGAYGGQTRKTFGALGDEVNLAARLMTTAAPGEILLSNQVYQAVEQYFVFEPRAPLPMKGKAEPVPIFALTGERKQRAIRLQEPSYALPMVGRAAELKLIEEKLDLALRRKSQIIGIVAEAGMGKSRLVAEVIRLAHKKGFIGYGGACQSDAVNAPYQAWKSIWSAFFDIDPAAPLKKQMRSVENVLEDYAPNRLEAMPLLNVMLDLAIPENDFTSNLEPQYRKSALTALLEDCLRAATNDQPVLIVIEDLHWIDALSHDLLEDLAKMLADSPVCFVLAYRPPQITRLQAPRLEALPQFTKIELHELSKVEAEQAIRAKLAQLYPAREGAVPVQLVDKLMSRAQGNPFYLEELLNYLRDRGLDPRDPADLEKIQLPDSLHTLVLSRIDQLSEREKTTLRVASIVGRLFRAAWLTGYYPALGELAHVKVDLDKLESMDITPLDSEPELAYLFKHIVTHEVTYESLPFGLRTQLHEQLARFLEKQISIGATPESALLDTLVFHYTRSENKAKQRLYLEKAGKAAFDTSAFHTAVEYFARLLELTPEAEPARSTVALQLAEAHLFMGEFAAARTAMERAQIAAKTDADRAAALVMLAKISERTGDYVEAQKNLAQAVPLARASNDPLTLCRALDSLGSIQWRLGNLDEARVALHESLALARTLDNVTQELTTLVGLGFVANDAAEEEQLYKQVYSRAVAVGNRRQAMIALNNLGVVADERQDYLSARDFHQEALRLAYEIGAPDSIALGLINLAEVVIQLGDLHEAHSKLREGLALALRLGVLPSVVAAVMFFGKLAYAEGNTQRALALLGLARIQPAWDNNAQHEMDLTLPEWALDPSVVEAGMAKGAELNWDETIRELLK
jgi:class 3 adenylate cyclase/tetratricopeptide (TPR) repeat protein